MTKRSSICPRSPTCSCSTIARFNRLIAAGIDSRSITTGSACHLDATMVHRGLHHLPWRDLDYLFIENVGNLVCPAVYDLGQAANVVALPVTEGEDKPLKYPVMFRNADLVLITKMDLLPHLPGVKIEAIADALSRVMPNPMFLCVSALTGAGRARGSVGSNFHIDPGHRPGPRPRQRPRTATTAYCHEGFCRRSPIITVGMLRV